MALPININELFSETTVERERLYEGKIFLVELPIHPDWQVQVEVQDNRGDNANEVQVEVQDRYTKEQVEAIVLKYCYRPQKRRDILSKIGLLSNQSNYMRHIYPLVSKGYVVLTIPDKPNSKHQQYRTTSLGQAYLLSLGGSRER